MVKLIQGGVGVGINCINHMSVSIQPNQRDLETCILGPLDPLESNWGKCVPNVLFRVPWDEQERGGVVTDMNFGCRNMVLAILDNAS